MSANESGANRIAWIEKSLDTPIGDYRKNAIALILAPYLISVRKYSYEESFSAIQGWVDKCDALKRLDSIFDYLIKNAVQNAIKNRYKPLKLENLKQRNIQLYNLLMSVQIPNGQ
jgi:Primase X